MIWLLWLCLVCVGRCRLLSSDYQWSVHLIDVVPDPLHLLHDIWVLCILPVDHVLILMEERRSILHVYSVIGLDLWRVPSLKKVVDGSKLEMVLAIGSVLAAHDQMLLELKLAV